MRAPDTHARQLRQVVLQPTPFCNLACSYCYLPHKDSKVVMSPEVLDAAFHFIRDNDLSGGALELRWHAGEPLVVPSAFYEDAFARAEAILGGKTRLQHSMQTNGVLLSEQWVDLFTRYGVRIGVSIDGPAELHNARRINRRGRGTFRSVMRGIEHLWARDIGFDVIAVITADTLRHADAFTAFFANLKGMTTLGFNVEESEGEHISDAFSTQDFEEQFRSFLRRLIDWSEDTGIPVREFEARRAFVLSEGDLVRNTQNVPFAILNVGVNGDLGTFSPELLGMSHPAFGGFSIGNVLSDTADAIFSSSRLERLQAEISRGIALCRDCCPYFALCGGGAPANKLYENGSFATAETQHCRNIVMAVTDTVLDAMEGAMHRTGS